MSTVELVVTDSRVWAVGPATHWDVAPSVVLGGDGSLVVGESLTPPTQVASAVQYVPAERIALLPRVPTVVESLHAVANAVFGNLGVPVPAATVTVVCPTEWGSYRRSALFEALRGLANEVVFEDIAVRAVAADAEAARGRRAVVVDCGALHTTASSVAPGPHGLALETCEFEPDLAIADLGVDPRADEALTDLLGAVTAGRPVDTVLVLGVTDPARVARLREQVRALCGPETEVRPVSGVDLVRPAQPEPDYAPAPPADEWLQPLRERAAAQQDPRERRSAYILGGVVAAAVVIALVVGAVVALGGSDGESVTAAPTTTSAALGPSPASGPPDDPPGRAPETFGHLRFQIPEGWKKNPAAGDTRVDLAPSDGARLRLTLIQTPVAANAGYEQIAADLENQMRQKPSMSDLRRDVVFGGRSMLAYLERPEGGSTVNWHVLVEHGTQVSIGCQYVGDAWESFATTCDAFAASVHVLP
ncbi:type VII secretion-associated protein [Nocardia takedensis]